MGQTLEVIVKVAERCNIACTYCYFFRGADQSYREHPARLTATTAAALPPYLALGARALDLDKVCVDFHGGEPLLMGREQFDALCVALRSVIGEVAPVELRCQTNGMLIDDTWIELFERHQVRVGVSIDGPREYHDEHRIGFDGRGTYDRVVAGIDRLRAAVAAGRLETFGVLCVIQPDRSARRIYRHLVDDLGIRMMDFLLPDNTHDAQDPFPVQRYGAFLCDLLSAWAEDADSPVRVRILESVYAVLLGGESRMMGFRRRPHHVITVSSNGFVGPDDTLRSCGRELMETGFNVATSELVDYLSSEAYRSIASAQGHLPTDCRACPWQRVCGGGLLVNRFARATGFDNRSVYCDALQDLYAFAAAHLIRSGVPEDEIVEHALA